MKFSNNQQAFLELVRAGLWEKEAYLLPYGDIDFEEIYRLAQEQTVVGLVAAGLEHVVDVKPPKETLFAIVGDTLQLEQRNTAMNCFIGVLVEKMMAADIYTLLVKGQGLAQCYERPLWRTCGDVDFFLSLSNYEKAKKFIEPLASSIQQEKKNRLHYSVQINQWEIELHGTLRSGLWRKLDHTIDEAQHRVFYEGAVRSWNNGNTQVFMPRIDEDVLFVFAHILQHLFQEGIGLRQICDWCRLLWTSRGSINNELLMSRLKSAGILSEWKVLSALAVDYLGESKDVIPFYSPKTCWSKKSKRVLKYILETGNFGHNRDRNYYSKKSIIKIKAISLWRHTKDVGTYLSIFPIDALKVWGKMIAVGIKEIVK